MPMHLRFAWRYFRARKSTQAINIIAWVSVSAIVVGTASLIIILSAFNGFEGLVRSMYSSFYTDLKVEPVKGRILRLDTGILVRMRGLEGVRSVSRIIEEKSVLQLGDYQTIVQMKGVESGYTTVAGIAERIVRGRFETGNAERPRLVLGVGVENAIGVLSDRSLMPVTMYLPRKGAVDLSDPLNALSQGEVYPAGSFAIQPEFDNKYVFTDFGYLGDQLGFGDQECTSVEIALTDVRQVEAVRSALVSMLGNDVRVLDKYEQNRTLYATIRMEKWAIYAIFSLILLVAAFNMIGALSMLVLEKQRDIQVLKAMGADDALIRRIFLTEGLLLAVIGLVLGLMIAYILLTLQQAYGLVPLQGQTFLIDHYPVRMVPGDFLLVSATVIFIGLAASLLPAQRAAVQSFTLRT
jgi:lipoprotein-releasing system permease protein